MPLQHISNIGMSSHEWHFMSLRMKNSILHTFILLEIVPFFYCLANNEKQILIHTFISYHDVIPNVSYKWWKLAKLKLISKPKLINKNNKDQDKSFFAKEIAQYLDKRICCFKLLLAIVNVNELCQA